MERKYFISPITAAMAPDPDNRTIWNYGSEVVIRTPNSTPIAIGHTTYVKINRYSKRDGLIMSMYVKDEWLVPLDILNEEDIEKLFGPLPKHFKNK